MATQRLPRVAEAVRFATQGGRACRAKAAERRAQRRKAEDKRLRAAVDGLFLSVSGCPPTWIQYAHCESAVRAAAMWAAWLTIQHGGFGQHARGKGDETAESAGATSGHGHTGLRWPRDAASAPPNPPNPSHEADSDGNGGVDHEELVAPAAPGVSESATPFGSEEDDGDDRRQDCVQQGTQVAASAVNIVVAAETGEEDRIVARRQTPSDHSGGADGGRLLLNGSRRQEDSGGQRLRGSGRLIPCRRGDSCPWHAMNRCRFFHPAPMVTRPRANLPVLLDRTVIAKGEAGWDYERLLGQWARRVQCHTLHIVDPYICGLRRSAALFQLMIGSRQRTSCRC